MSFRAACVSSGCGTRRSGSRSSGTSNGGGYGAKLKEDYRRYYGTRLSDIDPLQVIREGFQLIYSLNLRLPSRFVMLDKAIATLASVGVEVYPDFNVFEVAKPYARGLLADRFQPRVIAQRARSEALALGSVARELPYQVSDVLERMREGGFQVRVENPGIDHLHEHIDQASNRLAVALVVAAGLLGSSMIGVLGDKGPHVIGLHLLSFVGFVVSGAFGFWLIWGILRHGRL